uniref:BRCT domain-containing protein n=1 Tax=Astyanax mexicanus TaxID=7994 RepID=W5K8I4_ASTMX
MTTSRISPSVLKDVVAYVDVWSASKTENYSDPFIQQLQELGAKVSKTFNKQVTHVVFKHGHQSTWNKAKKMGVKIVSVHWVARCKETVEHAEEALYPAHHEESKLSQLKKRTHRCMQPRNAPVSTPKQLKRKLDKMMEDLARSSPVVVSDTSPFIIDEEHGIVYSPSSRRADTMAQRLREMRAQRENLSPTASQIQDSELDDSPRPSLGNTPTDLSKQLDEEEETGLSDARRSSNSDEGEQQYHDLPSVKKTLSVRSKKESLDSGVTFSSLNKTKETVKVPASPKTKRPRRSRSGLAKQSFLDSFVHKTSSKSLTLDPEPEEEEVPDESRRSSYNSKKSEISSPLSSVTSRVSQNPLCLKETTADINVSDSGRRPSLSNRSTKAQSKEQDSLKSEEKKQKVLKKKKQAAVVTDCKEVLKPSGGDDDDSVFEDYFSSAKNTPGRGVSFVDSSKSLDLPTFDLVPQNRNRRKSSSQMTLPANTKPEKTVNSKSRHISDASFSTQVFDKVSNEPLTKTVKNTPGHKGSFVDSSKSLDLPTFDLVPQNRNRRKSSSQETFKANAKPEKTVDRVSVVDSSKSLDFPTFDLVPQNRNRRKSSSQMTLPANTKPEKTVESKSHHISDVSFSTQMFDKVSNEPSTKTVKNTPGHKGSFVDSSKSLDLPTFDLVPQHRNGRKSSSQETFKANAKPEKTVDRVSVVDSSKSLDFPTFDLVPQNRNRRKSSSQMTLPANTKPEKTVESKSHHISDVSFSTQMFDKVSNEPSTKTVKNTPGHKGSFVDSSKSLDLPTFDLVPQNRNGRKSSSQETFKANAKPEKTVDRVSVVDSSKSLDLPTFDLVPQNRNRRKSSSQMTLPANTKPEKTVDRVSVVDSSKSLDLPTFDFVPQNRNRSKKNSLETLPEKTIMEKTVDSKYVSETQKSFSAQMCDKVSNGPFTKTVKNTPGHKGSFVDSSKSVDLPTFDLVPQNRNRRKSSSQMTLPANTKPEKTVDSKYVSETQKSFSAQMCDKVSNGPFTKTVKNTPGHKGSFVDSSKSVDLPTFDLVPQNRNRRKSSSQMTLPANTKPEKTVDRSALWTLRNQWIYQPLTSSLKTEIEVRKNSLETLPEKTIMEKTVDRSALWTLRNQWIYQPLTSSLKTEIDVRTALWRLSQQTANLKRMSIANLSTALKLRSLNKCLIQYLMDQLQRLVDQAANPVCPIMRSQSKSLLQRDRGEEPSRTWTQATTIKAAPQMGSLTDALKCVASKGV